MLTYRYIIYYVNDFKFILFSNKVLEPSMVIVRWHEKWNRYSILVKKDEHASELELLTKEGGEKQRIRWKKNTGKRRLRIEKGNQRKNNREQVNTFRNMSQKQKMKESKKIDDNKRGENGTCLPILMTT